MKRNKMSESGDETENPGLNTENKEYYENWSKRIETLHCMDNDKFKECIEDEFWDVVPTSCKFLSCSTNSENHKKMLMKIAETSNPKDTLLSFLKEISKVKSDEVFVIILKPLKIVLFRLKNKHNEHFSLTFDTLLQYVRKLPKPENMILEGDELKLLESDAIVRRINFVYKELMGFTKALIDEIVVSGRFKFSDLTVYKETSLEFILQLLEIFGFLYLSTNDYVFESSTCACQMISQILLLENNCLFFLEDLEERQCIISRRLNNISRITEKREKKSYKISLKSYSVYCYLLFTKSDFVEQIPLVYNPIYLFQTCIVLIIELISQPEFAMINKGLVLSDCLLRQISNNSLPYYVLDSDKHKDFNLNLVNVMVYCEVLSYRKLAVQIFKTYFNKFEPKGQYQLYLNLFPVVNHFGVLGLLVTMIKDSIMINMEDDVPYFKDKYLCSLLSEYLLLRKGHETDLVESCDLIISGLNLLRFVLISDRFNVTQIWNFIKTIDNIMLTPLQRGLNFSRAHYELKIKQLNLNSDSNQRKCPEINVSVSGQPLPELSMDQEKRALQSALNIFDVIESLLCRVYELMLIHQI